jgi:hypothetical protein
MPSWPAPLGSLRTGSLSAAIASPICAWSQSAQGAVLPSWVFAIFTLTPRRSQIACISRTRSAAAASREPSRGLRTSIVNFTLPGTTFTAPGRHSSLPTVPTSSASAAARRSTARTHSAAAAIASCRSVIGTVPACPAMPSISTA